MTHPRIQARLEATVRRRIAALADAPADDQPALEHGTASRPELHDHVASRGISDLSAELLDIGSDLKRLSPSKLSDTAAVIALSVRLQCVERGLNHLAHTLRLGAGEPGIVKRG